MKLEKDQPIDQIVNIEVFNFHSNNFLQAEVDWVARILTMKCEPFWDLI